MGKYALIKNNIVEQVIVAEASFFQNEHVQITMSQFDEIEDVTDLSPYPGPSWTKDPVSKTFSPPTE